MDFSAWNWATGFRLHEAACLIAGVMPIPKRHPTSEELTLPLFRVALNPRFTRPFYAVLRTSAARTASG